MLGEAAGKIDNDCSYRDTGDGQRARERGRKARRGVRERRQDEDRAPPSVGREFACAVARHRRRDHHVGVERQMRSMRLDRTDRQHDDGACAVEIAHFLPGELRQLMYRHQNPSLYTGAESPGSACGAPCKGARGAERALSARETRYEDT